jgi:putative GTP pyrophosphokinase
LIVETPIFLENEKRMMKVEVQLRTIAMDFWASLDHKLQYKKNISEDMQESLKAQLLECANISADLDKRMEAIRNQLEEAQSESKP